GMNQSTLTHLKVIVERVVRPVRASAARKRRMREELLAHVTAVFEEESAKLGDERVALERTGQRFGNADELTGQMQKSVPARDFRERFMGKVIFVVVFWLVLFGAGEFPHGTGRTILDVGLAAVGVIFLADLLRRARGDRSWRRAVPSVVCSLLLF